MKKRMTERALFAHFVACTAVIAAGLTHPGQASVIIYNIAPVALSAGFQIAGGTITTDGTTGSSYDRSSVLDYEVNITGPVNFVFTPSNSSVNLDAELTVTDTEIFFPALPTGVTADLRFSANEMLDPFATTLASQQVFWSQGSNNVVSQAGFISVSFGNNVRQPSHGQGSTRQPMLDRYVVAVVPEPSSLGILSVLAIGWMHRRRSNRI